MPSLRATGELAPHAHPFQAKGGTMGLPTKCASPSTKVCHVASPAATATTAGDVAEITRQSIAPNVLPRPPLPPGSKVVTPIHVHRLAPLLKDYDPHLCQFLISGITYGFSIGAIGTLPIFDISVRNLQSAFQLPHVILRSAKNWHWVELSGHIRLFLLYQTIGYHHLVLSPRRCLGNLGLFTICHTHRVHQLMMPFLASFHL